jgi:hypothetical protein
MMAQARRFADRETFHEAVARAGVVLREATDGRDADMVRLVEAAMVVWEAGLARSRAEAAARGRRLGDRDVEAMKRS